MESKSLVMMKALSLIETLMSLITLDARVRPVYEKSIKISDSVHFMLERTEFMCIPSFLTTILLARGPYRADTYLP